MNLTPEQEQELSELAASFLTPREIAIILDVDFEEFFDEIKANTKISRLYHKPILLRKAKIRGKILSLAEMGSPPAQTMANEFMKEQQIAFENDTPH